MIIFDIETGPWKIGHDLFPFVPPDRPGEFDELSVKIGNLTDPDKIRKKIDDAREKHHFESLQYSAKVEELREQHKIDGLRDATLCSVIAIGYLIPDESESIPFLDFSKDRTGGEAELISAFWKTTESFRSFRRNIVGWNILGFDIPMLVRRSIILDIPVPQDMIMETGRWPRGVVDLMRVWQSTSSDRYAPLDRVARSLGLDGKNGDGRMFWSMTNEEQVSYLSNDIVQTYKVAKRFSVRSIYDE